MGSIIDFLNAWRELIVKVFSQHTIAAAFVTVAAVVAFLALEYQFRRGKTTTNLMLVLLGWAVLVPMGGLLTIVIGKIWDVSAGLISTILIPVIASFYRIYEQHPLAVLTMVGLAVISYFAWATWWPRVVASRILRVSALVVGVVVLAHIVGPLLNLLFPATSSSPSKDLQGNVPQSTPAQPVSTIREMGAPKPSGPSPAQGAAPQSGQETAPPSKPGELPK
jgi:hypothetical protein